MKSWEVLEICIPRHKTERAAQLLSVCADYVRRWKREPESEDAPTASGQRSILDRICDLLDVVFLINPTSVGLIVEFINNHYQQLMNTHAVIIGNEADRCNHVNELLKETTEAITSLNVTGCTVDTITELVQMRDAADRAIAAVRRTMRDENTIR